jgi:hypothetical protein
MCRKLRWNDQAGAVTDESALNPVHFATRSTAEVLSTLAHAIVHLWQHHCGTTSRSTYHNKAWAAKMDAIGLCPSHTGAPGSTRTGQHMSHSVVVGGPFTQACTDRLVEGLVISWRDRVRAQVPGQGKTEGKAGVRTTYTCPHYGLKPGRRQTWGCSVARVRWRWNRLKPEAWRSQDTRH